MHSTKQPAAQPGFSPKASSAIRPFSSTLPRSSDTQTTATANVSGCLRTSIAVPQSFFVTVSHSSRRLLRPPLDGAISLTPPEQLVEAPRRPADHRSGETISSEATLPVLWCVLSLSVSLFSQLSRTFAATMRCRESMATLMTLSSMRRDATTWPAVVSSECLSASEDGGTITLIRHSGSGRQDFTKRLKHARLVLEQKSRSETLVSGDRFRALIGMPHPRGGSELEARRPGVLFRFCRLFMLTTKVEQEKASCFCRIYQYCGSESC